MNFAHISDTHIRRTPIAPIVGFPLEAQLDLDGGKLRAVLRKIKNQEQRADAVFISGDLVHEDVAEDYSFSGKYWMKSLRIRPITSRLEITTGTRRFTKGFSARPGNREHIITARK
ncbi:MAG: metallophosphoesterase [Oscillospiraceae bacterium]|jgi:3',5'-cyclic AMP phosphodiesterase CpdA|nr:metallophosphoesterase [Oscillospiraceae bacterium]